MGYTDQYVETLNSDEPLVEARDCSICGEQFVTASYSDIDVCDRQHEE